MKNIDGGRTAGTGTGRRASGKARAWWMLIGVIAAAVAIFLALGFAVSWGLAAIFAIIMVPGGISMAIIARHPERTGGRQMLGVSDPNTLLEPFTGRRPSSPNAPKGE